MTPLPPETLLEALNWRYATKQFDPTRKIDEPTWAALEQALVLTPSSFGLQPWKFIVVDDVSLREQLVAASWGQSQPRDAARFVVFAVKRDLGADHIGRHVERTAEIRGIEVSTLEKFRAVITRSLDGARTKGHLDTWQTHQIYIALGQFMAAAAVLGVDTCPMEGLAPAKFDEILGLSGTGWHTVVACAAGYRLAADKYATTPKVRFRLEDVIEHR